MGWALANECVRLSRQAIFLLCFLGALLGQLRAGKGGRALGQWDGGGMTQAAEQGREDGGGMTQAAEQGTGT